MAKRNPVKDTPGLPQVSPVIGLKLLRELLSKGQELLQNRPLSSDGHSTWELLARNYLEKVFGVYSPNVSTVLSDGVYAISFDADENFFEQKRAENLQTQLKKIEGLIELLNTEIQLSEGEPIQSKPTEFGYKIFLVHGHDIASLHETARFLEKLNQDVIILHEQPNQGKTIIEKFIDYSEVGFAVVFLTPDDRGGTISTSFEKQLLRARQNVIFELGYFIGKLGRNRVCALYSQGVEIPSDYSGVLFIEFDDRGAWRLALAREMKAAGFNIDMNLAV
jgi:predicted nucleotide-binding protein